MCCLDPKQEWMLVELPGFQPRRFPGRPMAAMGLLFSTAIVIQAGISGYPFCNMRLRHKLV
jgi:hypothetical protein